MRMELAATLHHSSFRGALPETYDASRSQMTAKSREDSVFFDSYDEDTEGAWPDRLFEVRQQERDQRRTVEQTGRHHAHRFRRLMLLCRRWITNWWRVCRQLDVRIPEQAIEVPKNHLHPANCGRTVGGSADDHLLFFPFTADCGAERRYSSSWSWRATRRSSRFSSQTDFNCAAERILEQIVDSRVVGWRPSRFSPSPGFRSVFFKFS